jgi:arginyl-tRNA synthetase
MSEYDDAKEELERLGIMYVQLKTMIRSLNNSPFKVIYQEKIKRDLIEAKESISEMVLDWCTMDEKGRIIIKSDEEDGQ